ncbi:hypothetical protein HWV62_37595 [Athelia sp. TMB]|nr:hypothetical protein HWV62_37595 [Athelia sp. TMB]
MANRKAREYCCCAIPLVNAGIYTVLIEQLVFTATAGTLAIATTSIVGASTPSFAKWIFAIVCYVAAALQVLGIIAVAQDKAITFRRFLTLHGIVAAALFAVGAAWEAISASRHSKAQSACITDFFPNSSSSLGTTMCNIFPWVDVGIMGGMLVFFALVHIYFYVVMSSYSNAQQRAHDDYAAGGETKSLTNDIPMTNRWDNRPLNDPLLAEGVYTSQRNIGGYDHHRSNSGQSVSTVLAEPIQREYNSYDQNSYLQREPSTRYPETVHTQEPGPTPVYHDNYYSGEQGNSDLNRPLPSQPHPGEY